MKKKKDHDQSITNDSIRVADYYAELYNIDKKQIEETDQDYRNRIAYYLRDNKNKIIEGQSVLSNEFMHTKNSVDKYNNNYRTF